MQGHRPRVAGEHSPYPVGMPGRVCKHLDFRASRAAATAERNRICRNTGCMGVGSKNTPGEREAKASVCRLHRFSGWPATHSMCIRRSSRPLRASATKRHGPTMAQKAETPLNNGWRP